VHRPRRQPDSPWSDDTPLPSAREPADTLPLGTRAHTPHWTEGETAADGTPVILHDAPSPSGERSFLAPEEATVEASMRFDEAVPTTLPLGTGVAPPSPPPALPVTREVPSARTAGPLSTALPPRNPTVWAPRTVSERPSSDEGLTPLRTTLFVTVAAVIVLVAVVFAYLVLAAPA
jgi:hypothetical protein